MYIHEKVYTHVYVHVYVHVHVHVVVSCVHLWGSLFLSLVAVVRVFVYISTVSTTCIFISLEAV